MGREQDRFKELLRLLPEGWEAKAKELGALQRAREIKTAGELLHLILLYLTEGRSFRGTSALLDLSKKAHLSDVAILKRMRNSASWLQWLCENIFRKAGLTVEKPQWLKNKNIRLVDGTSGVKCGVRRQCYKLHYSIDLFTLSAHELHITDEKTGEKLSNFKKLRKGDIVMGDRIYGTMPGITHIRQLGADYVLRIKAHNFPIYNEKKQKIDILKNLSALQRGEVAEIKAKCLINDQYDSIRICAMRKDRKSELAGLKRLVKENQRKQGGKLPTNLQQASNMYIILATSLGDKVTTAQVLELYRMRWQIEIAFKRLKSLFRYNDLPAKNSKSVNAWFYGKLLLAALCETLVNTGRFSPSGKTSRR